MDKKVIKSMLLRIRQRYKRRVDYISLLTVQEVDEMINILEKGEK